MSYATTSSARHSSTWNEVDSDVWKNHMNDSPSPFTLVSQNLVALGSITIDRFLSSPSSDIFDSPLDLSDKKLAMPPSPPQSPLNTPDTPQTPLLWENKPSKSNPSSFARMQTVVRLHQTCQRVFGNSDAVKFEFLEEAGPNTKRCILTITRPDGPTRSYTTEPVFARKNDAKAHAASIAISMGAIDFIVTGNSDPSKAKKGLVLAPLDAAGIGESLSADLAEVDPSVKEIEDCCKYWRAGRVKPHWVALNEPKFENKHGTALRIELSPHSCQVYSSETIHDSIFEAKQACARIALRQGVLDFIKFGNGQTQPLVLDASDKESGTEVAGESVTSRVSAFSSASSLQNFYESLPKPFPEDFGDKTASEINAPAWLNTTVQAARGGKLSTHFIWTTDGTFGLHGCLLRIDRPEESKSYLVDAKFPKRADAKAAVCLQAMSQGIGNYIRDIGSAVDNKITPSMRKVANQIFPVLASECYKIRPDIQPLYDFNKDRDAYGCTMKVELCASPSPEDIKEYIVPAEYRTKADAKIAVALQAVQQGVIELLRFRGEPPPPGYVPSLASRSKDVTNESMMHKRKELDNDDVQDNSHRKKRRKVNKSSSHQGDVPFFNTKEEVLAPRRIHALPNRPFDSQSANHNSKDIRKGLHASGSGGLGSISGPVHTGQVDQYRSGSRDVDDFLTPYGGGPQASYTSNLSGSHPPDGRLAYGGEQVAPYGVAPHRPPSEPFQGGAYPPPSTHPSYGIHRAGSGIAHYPLPPGLNSGLVHNSGYVPPYGTVAVSHNAYPSSHYAQPYQSAIPPSYFAQGPPVTYAVGPSPVVPTGFTPGYASATGHRQNYYQTPAQQQQQEPSQQSLKNTRNKLGWNAQGLKDDRPSDKCVPVKRKASEQESEEINEARTSSKFNADDKEPGQSSLSDRQTPHGQTLQASPPSSERSKPPLTGSSPKDRAPSSKPDIESGSKLTVEQPPKSYVRALLDYCNKDGSPKPQFRDEVVTTSSGETTYKVWVIMGMERLELPVTFASLDEGRERVAKQILSRLRSQGKKGKGKTEGTQRQ